MVEEGTGKGHVGASRPPALCAGGLLRIPRTATPRDPCRRFGQYLLRPSTFRNYKTPEPRFRALLSEGATHQVELVRA